MIIMFKSIKKHTQSDKDKRVEFGGYSNMKSTSFNKGG